MIFAVIMLAMAAASIAAIVISGGGFWAGLGLAVAFYAIYRLGTSDRPPHPDAPRHGTNAFQKRADRRDPE